MRWEKRGHIFGVGDDGGWMKSHAQIPTVLVLPDRLRVYFATRPEPGLALTTFLDLDRDDPGRVLEVHDRPILELGAAGHFDEHGIMPSWVCENEGEVWLYYGGWSRRQRVPYSNWTGLAVSRDGGRSFERRFPGPVLDRTPHEVFSATGAFGLRQGSEWWMAYASGVEWLEVEGKLEEFYVVKSARSTDGLHWERENRRLLPAREEHEPTHRPVVLARDGRYHMWFCRRSVRDFRDGAGAYRLGYATSTDLTKWERNDDEAGIDVSESGWDASMIAYPYVVECGSRTYLFYNGNGFGASGFGWAELCEDETK